MITIKTYHEQYQADFIRLNKEWIETYFRLEESDLRTFANIDSYILGNGGQIFLAIDDSSGKVVGCCALINHRVQVGFGSHRTCPSTGCQKTLSGRKHPFGCFHPSLSKFRIQRSFFGR